MSKFTLRKTLFIGLIFLAISVKGQRDRVEYLSNFDKEFLHWGFYLGLNYNSFNIMYRAPEQFPDTYVETQPLMGFNVGLVGDMRLHRNINIRTEPGLMTNKKYLYFKHLPTEMDSVRTATTAFLHVPVLLQFSTNRIHNFRPYLAVGLAYDYNFSSNFNNPDDNSSGEFRMQKHVLAYELAIGMDFYFYYFKFSPSIRGIFAINNELKYDQDTSSQWTAPIDYFGTRGVFFRMTFQ